MPPLLAFARARPEVIRITETYAYEQELSRNPLLRADSRQDPSGEIEVAVPYDGYHSFGQQALNDIRCQLPRLHPDRPAQVLIGHLAIANFGRTDLDQVLDLRGNSSTVPLFLPVAGQGIRPEQLTGDRRACMLGARYTIAEPRTWPLRMELRVIDETTVFTSADAFRANKIKDTLAGLVNAITKQLNARRDLIFEIFIETDLPNQHEITPLTPIANRVSITWPTIPSPETLSLTLEGAAGSVVTPIRYDPLVRRLLWSQVPLRFKQYDESTKLSTYRTDAMQLHIGQPGDLYAQAEPTESTSREGNTPAEEISNRDLLIGEVEVNIPGWLLSGLDARLFDGLGRLASEPIFSLVTRLNTRFRVILDDLFERRILSPRHHLCFDQVIPDDMRWLDIQTALRDRGFRVEGEPVIQQDGEEVIYTCAARRPQSPYPLLLGLVARGRRHTTRRESTIPGGQRYTSIFESGELTVHLVAETTGNSRALVEEMNALQMALRERFERVKANR